MLATTLNKIKEHYPCESGWRQLLTYLGKTKSDDEPLPFLTILESNGIEDAIWCTRSAPEYDKYWRLFAVWCARQVQHLLTDEKSIKVIDIAEAYANGMASDHDLLAASLLAWNAGNAAAINSANNAAWNAARAVARISASAAASHSANSAAWAAAFHASSNAEWNAAVAARSKAAGKAIRDAQQQQFIKIIGD